MLKYSLLWWIQLPINASNIKRSIYKLVLIRIYECRISIDIIYDYIKWIKCSKLVIWFSLQGNWATVKNNIKIGANIFSYQLKNFKLLTLALKRSVEEIYPWRSNLDIFHISYIWKVKTIWNLEYVGHLIGLLQ